MSARPAPAVEAFPVSIGHELRSALNAIQSWAHVLENELVDGGPAVKRAIAGIIAGVEQQVRIIESFEAAQGRRPDPQD
jgi:signal transduction histidine kinase